ncbi:hypothetical protein [Amycolatopsis sp. lyj-109]|uniref:hypothetical protein n=1 Tax=Amycolatopsis sp. lyj-109 TaxID=2789287 RepID=UPI00397D2195
MQKNTISAKRSFVTLLIASMLAALGVLSTPAAGYASTSEDYPVTEFRLPYGASLLAGSITWHYRDVHITGSVKAVSTGKTARFRAESPDCLTAWQTRTASVGTTRGFVVDETCNYPGGFTIVYIELWDTNGIPLRRAICTANGCVDRD